MQNWGMLRSVQSCSCETNTLYTEVRHTQAARAQDPCLPREAGMVMDRGLSPGWALHPEGQGVLLLSPGLQDADRQFFNASLQFINTL